MYTDIEPKIQELYVATGKVTFEKRYVKTEGEQSSQAAQAVLCAGDQGQSSRYLAAMLTAWTQVVGAAYKPEALVKTAASLGLDTATFSACLTGGKYVQQISDNTVAAGKLGIEKLPVVLVNEAKIESLQPWDTYARAIEAALAK